MSKSPVQDVEEEEGNEEIPVHKREVAVDGVVDSPEKAGSSVHVVKKTTMTTRGVKGKKWGQDEEGTPNPVSVIDEELVQEFVNQTGCPVFACDNRLSAEDTAQIMLVPSGVDPDKVCVRIPPSCPDQGYWVFVISLDHVDPDDLSYDDLGKWNKPSGRRNFYRKSEKDERGIEIARGIGQKEPLNWDYCIRCNRYCHPGTDEGTKFYKWTYVAFNTDYDLLGPYAVVIYEAGTHPSNLRRLSHANAKTGEKPLVRTKKSTLKQAKALLATQTPKQVMETLMAAQAISGDTDPVDLPKSTQQLSSMAQKVQGSVRSNRGRPRGPLPSRTLDYQMPPEDNYAFSAGTPAVSRAPVGKGPPPVLQVQVLQAEKRKYDMETEKLETENEKLRLEMTVLKAKKYKLDLEIGKLRGEMDDQNVLIVQDGGVEYGEEYN